MNGAIRLKLARREFFSGGGFTGTFTPISAKVKNLAFEKQVAALYTPDGTAWKDVPLTHAAHCGDYDVFSKEVNEQVLQFVIRYAVAGTTFFDNNSGQNYRFTSNLAVVGGNVVLHKATARRGTQAGGGFVVTTSWVEGEILVNNLAFAKDVGIRLSADGGLTWHDTHAVFAGANAVNGIFVGPGAEAWKFKSPELNLDPSAAEFRFAVFYGLQASGQVFWDNNFGQDYRLSKADGATIN
jgi:Carbohydrate/starch-binding module (family 21)